MNAFQSFLASRPFGFITMHDIDELVRLHRLCPVLVRCGCVRFTCGAQYLKEMLRAVELLGDYVRDCSVAPGAIEAADQWLPERQHLPRIEPITTKLAPAPKPRRADFNEADCGGVFDGFGVVSDADPCL